MGAVWMLARVELRRRWRGLVVLALLVGVVGAVVLAAAAGARRSATAFERFETQSLASDVEINVGDVTPAQVDAFRRTPGIAAIGEVHQLAMFAKDTDFLALAGAVDTRFGRIVDRARVLRGRHADPDAALELEISEDLAEQLGVDVGGEIDFLTYSQADVDAASETENAFPEATGPEVTVAVVGIVRRPLDLGVRGAAGGVVVLTPAFTREYRDRIGSWSGSILRVRTERGAVDVPDVVAAARDEFSDSPVFDVLSIAVETQGTREAIDVLTVALWIFGAVVALAGAVTIALVLGRGIAFGSVDQPTLRALGLPRARRAAVAVAAITPVVVGGVALAALGAFLLSPRFPIGLARQADPDLGLHVDAPVVLGGVALIALLVLTVVAAAAWATIRRADREAREGADHPRGSVVARTSERLGLSPVVGTGVRMALEAGRGRTAVPVRSAVAGTAVAIVGIVAAFTFASSSDRLQMTPAAYGRSWDAEAFDQRSQPSLRVCAPGETALTQEPSVDAISSVCRVNVQIDRAPVTALGFTSLTGAIRPTIVEGRAPAAPDEVALGSATLEDLGKAIGDTVTVTSAGGSEQSRIVGRAALPSLGEPQPVADGAVFTGRGLGRVESPDAPGEQFFVLRFAPGVDPSAAARRLTDDRAVAVEVVAEKPLEIERLAQVDQLPVILAAFLAALAVVAVGHALVTAVRRRRRDLAVLKTLGLGQRQVRATIAWQATTLAAAGLSIGIPLGALVGRGVWQRVAASIGVAPSPHVPALALAIIVVVSVVVANVVAYLPGRSAANTQPAAVLRSE